MSLPRFRLVQGKALGERSTPSGPPQQQQMSNNNMQQQQEMIKQEIESDSSQEQRMDHQQGSQMMQGMKQENPISPPRQMMGGQAHQMMPQRQQMMQQQNQNMKQEDPLSPPRGGQMMGGPPPSHMMPQQQRSQQMQQQHHYQQHPQQLQSHQNSPQIPLQNPQNTPQHLQNPQQILQNSPQIQNSQNTQGGGLPGPPGAQQNEDKNVQKCVRFLKTLISLSQNEDVEMPDKAARVRTLIQGVIYAETTAEEFTRDLQQVLKSQAQPHLLPFLQNTLPALRNAVRNGTANVEGVNPPPGYVFNNGRHPVGGPPSGPPSIGSTVGPQGPPQQHQMTPQGPPSVVTTVGGGGSQIISRLNSDSTPQNRNPNFQPRPGPQGPPMQSTPVGRTMSGGPQIQNQGLQNLQGPQIQNQAPPPNRAPQQAPQPMEVDDTVTQGGPQLAPPPLQQRSSQIRNAALKCDEILARITKRLQAPCSVEEGALVAISDAVESHLREMIAMMAGYAEHRVESMRVPDNYVPIDDVKRQLRFLEDLDRQEEEMRENREKESLIRMSKNKNIGKETIEKAKEMQRVDAEAKRNRDANAAAIAALSSNRNVKSKWDGAASTSAPPRPRTVRVTTRDLHLLVNQDNRFMGTFIREKLSYGGPAIDTTI